MQLRALAQSSVRSSRQDMDFTVGEASAFVFWHQKMRIRVSVYADDFTSKVPNPFDTCSKQTFTGSMRPPRMRGSDQDPKDGKEGRVLNMVMRLTSPEIEIEAYPRQAEKLTK